MAIGTGLALLGSAAIGAAGSIFGGRSQSRAATQATASVSADNASNRAFLESIYGRNAGALSPWATTGATANNAIMELLGFPPGGGMQQQPAAFANYNGGMPSNGFNGGARGQMSTTGGYGDGWSPEGWHEGWQMPQPVPGGVTTNVPNARSAFDTYRGSTGYDFRVNEGNRALQSAFSRNLESGAASKAAIRFGQGIASDEFSRYMGYLTGQSQMGLSGASALAGVGQNFGNTVVAGNQAAATAAANARMYSGNANAQMWQGLGSSFGQAMGAFGKGF